MAAEQAPGVLYGHVSLDSRLEEVSQDCGDGNRGAEHNRLPDREVAVTILVEGEEGNGDRGRRAGNEPLPGLLRRQRGSHSVATDQPADEVGGGVVRPDGEEDGEQREAAALGVADEHEGGEPAGHPDDAEHRRPHRACEGRSCVGDPEDEEREDERAADAGEEPGCAAELRAEENEHEAGVPAEHERSEPARDHVELVEGEDPADQREREEPPVAEPDQVEHHRQQGGADENARPEGVHATGRRSDAAVWRTPPARLGDLRRRSPARVSP